MQFLFKRKYEYHKRIVASGNELSPKTEKATRALAGNEQGGFLGKETSI